MNAPVRVGILALQGGVREHAHTLETLGAQVTLVRRPHELSQVEALVLPGGESSMIDKLSRAFDLQKPIQAAIAAGLPVYGTCAGLILLADRICMPLTWGRSRFGPSSSVRPLSPRWHPPPALWPPCREVRSSRSNKGTFWGHPSTPSSPARRASTSDSWTRLARGEASQPCAASRHPNAHPNILSICPVASPKNVPANAPMSAYSTPTGTSC